jgi:uncharacterized protein YprB with RNaseH-like and TPR domain
VVDLKRKLARLGGNGPSAPARSSGASSAQGEPVVESGRQDPPSRAPLVPREPSASRTETESKPASPPDKLRRLVELRARIDAMMTREAQRPRRATPPPATQALPTVARETPAGPLHVCESLYGLAHRHGTVPIGACLDAASSLVADLALDPDLAAVDLRRLLFFDLETTGLAGGTGTLPFIVGLAWFEGEQLRVEQLFLRRPGEEGPMLRYFADRLAVASALVSFNGKSFDWPLLRTRFVLNRLPAPEPVAHLDLLHCSRRVFRERLPQLRLGQLERDVLGFERQEDIDSALIPASYFAFLRDGDGSALVPVFTHNAHDLLALAAVLGRLAAMYAQVSDDDPRDHLGLAQVAARAGDSERALSVATAAAGHASGRYAVAGLRLAAETLRRRGEFAHAATLLEQALGEAGSDPVEAATIHLRLSKLYEHKLADLDRALTHAQGTPPAETKEDCARRLARLRRRMGVTGD